MKIKNILDSKKLTLSFEIFPPKKQSNLENVVKTAESLSSLNPDFMSITYGAGGTTRGNTVEIAQKILENAIERYGFSSRANASGLKLSRTIADMAGSQEILPEHLKEAIEMRKTYANLLESA